MSSKQAEPLTRNELKTARAKARFWALDKWRAIMTEVNARPDVGGDADAREVYVSELMRAFRSLDEDFLP
jgi:hypothetical protein